MRRAAAFRLTEPEAPPQPAIPRCPLSGLRPSPRCAGKGWLISQLAATMAAASPAARGTNRQDCRFARRSRPKGERKGWREYTCPDRGLKGAALDLRVARVYCGCASIEAVATIGAARPGDERRDLVARRGRCVVEA